MLINLPRIRLIRLVLKPIHVTRQRAVHDPRRQRARLQHPAGDIIHRGGTAREHGVHDEVHRRQARENSTGILLPLRGGGGKEALERVTCGLEDGHQRGADGCVDVLACQGEVLVVAEEERTRPELVAG